MHSHRSVRYVKSVDEIPTDFLSYRKLWDMYPEVPKAIWKRLAKELGEKDTGYVIYPKPINLTSSDIITGLDCNVFEKIISTYKWQLPGPDITSFRDLCLTFNIDAKTLEAAVVELGIIPEFYQFSKVISKGFTSAQVKVITDSFATRPNQAPQGYISIGTILEEYKLLERQLLDEIFRLGIEPEEYTFKWKLEPAITLEQFEQLQPFLTDWQLLGDRIDVLSQDSAAKKVKLSAKTLNELANGAGVVLTRYAHKRRSCEGYTNSQLEEIKKAYDGFNIPGNHALAISFLVSRYQISKTQLLRLAKEAGITPQVRRVHTCSTLSITANEFDEINEHSGDILTAIKLPRDAMPIQSLAKGSKMTDDDIIGLIRGAGIEPNTYRTSSAKPVQAIGKDQLELVKSAYSGF